MLATVAHHPYNQHFPFDGRQDRYDDAMSFNASDYQQLLLSSQGFRTTQSTDHFVPPLVTTQQRQSSYNAPQQYEQTSLYASSGVAYLGQTLPPSSQASAYSSSPAYSSFDDHQLQPWLQKGKRKRSEPAVDTSQQRQPFEAYTQQQSLQAGSNDSIASHPSSRASAAPSTRRSQAPVFSQAISQKQYHPPHPGYTIGSQQQQQHLHHHSLPARSPVGTIPSNNHKDSSREEESGGAPSMVGCEGMPEPAARPKGPKLKFSGAEDALLVELKEGKALTWKQIADFFPGRSSGTLQVRYCTKLKAKTTVWTDEMVSRLRTALIDYEQDRWRIISSKVGNGFSSSACHDKAIELQMEVSGQAIRRPEQDDYEDCDGSA